MSTTVPALHRRAAERFGQLVHAVQPDQWRSPTPCEAWDVRALVNHVVGENRWVPPLFAGRTVTDVGNLLDGDLLGTSPRSAWDESAAAADAAIHHADAMNQVVHLSFGDVPGSEYVTQLVADLVIHGWDLAHAIGRDERLDPELVQVSASWFSGVADLARRAGAVGPALPVAETADAQARLLAAFGRQPAAAAGPWRCGSGPDSVASSPPAGGLTEVTSKGCRMRALQFTEYGGPDVVTVGDAPDPHAGPGQIRIAVRAASVNPIDWKAFSGAMSDGRPMAGTGYLGYDAAGVVDEVGEGVTGVSVGDDVFGRGRNTQAEYAVLGSWAVKPSSIDWAVAAAAGVAGETSERGLRLLGVKSGDTIFIDGGAGGVGAVAVQMALARGARVIASAGEGNQDYLREIRAIPVLYGEGMVARVRDAAGGSIDAVFDVVGKTPIEDLIGLVSEPSRVLSIANFGAAEAGAQLSGGGADSRPMEALAEVAELLAQNKLVIKIQTFPFDRAAEAYRVSQAGHVRGKLVLIP